MIQKPFDKLACPLDGLPLQPNGQSMVCANNHNFDFDRKDAINLLSVQFKKSKNPGDSKEMIGARNRFLNTGFYQPISDQLNQLVINHSNSSHIFDAGCGEGYYTDRLALFLSNQKNQNEFSIVGMDISKDAIHAAAKRDKDISWVVGTNAKIPVLDQSIDIIASLFGFPVWNEFARILKPNSIIITADVGPDHLIELRNILYPEIKTKTGDDIIPDGFKLLEQHRLHQTLPLPIDALISDLLTMTPHGYRAVQEKREQALQTTFEIMTLDVVFKIYCAKNSA